MNQVVIVLASYRARMSGALSLMSLLVACSSTDAPTTPVSAGLGGDTASIGGSSARGGASIGGSSSAGGLPGTGGSTAATVAGGTNSGGGAPIAGGLTATGGANSPTGGALTTGGSKGVGGGSAGVGTVSTGGSKSASGGTATTGGSGSKSTGGVAAATGGTPTGGTLATGGSMTVGGAAPTGGTKATGGAAPTGGTTSTGSATLCPGATQTITVNKNGGGQYTTVQAAINSISSSNSKLIQVNVKAGTYAEQVTISTPFVCLVGDSATTTKITHAAGTNIVTGGTVIVTGSDFSAANIAFENTGGNGSGQAVALMAQGARQQFLNCRFLSYQDTLYTNTGTQYFKDCYIEGDTDYIFGDATAVFQNCTMNNIAQGTAVTAPRTPQNTTYGLVFLGGSLTANPTTSSVPSGSVYLGRPWGPYGAVAYLNVAMGAHINAAGWTTMSGNTLANVRFYEYKSTGSGANPTNATRSSRQLSDAQAANYTVKNILNPWVPGYSQ